MYKHNIIIFALLQVCCFAAFSCSATSQPSKEAAEENMDESKPETKHLTLLFAGDLMQHLPQANAARLANGKYDFSHCFDYVRDEISSADVAVANFEITTAGPPYCGFPRFSTPDAYVDAVIGAGFDLLTTANNHSCDRGRQGIERTIHVMDSLGIKHLGTYAAQEDRNKQYPYLLEKNGFRIVFLNYTYDTNGIPVPKGDIVNTIDTTQMAMDIAKAKMMKPDVIIALMHWGVEYTMKPISRQVELADWLFAHGVTHIIGGHPHVVEPVEVRTDAQGDKHVLAYSLGNFISNQKASNGIPKDGGMMVKLELSKDSTVRLDKSSYCLEFVSRPVSSSRKQYIIFPVNTPDSVLEATERAQRDAYLHTVRPMFKNGNKGDIKEYLIDIKRK